jgi:ubiquinone/menaquinone biosynthesis C-methylase UbiE
VASERISRDVTSPLWAEHRSRYLFAARFTAGRTVLDVACGEGIGLEVLAQEASRVVGVDLAFQGLLQAKQYAGAEALLCAADGTTLPFETGTFDVVTSFETIEHVEDDEAFVKELRRVSAPEGVLLLSTPNAVYTNPIQGRSANPFHIREYRPEELEALLSRYWSDVRLMRQRTSDIYGVCPYWESKEQLPKDIRTRAGVVLWKLERRLPGNAGRWMSRRLSRRELYPTEKDFVITSTGRDGHVLVALCKP